MRASIHASSTIPIEVARATVAAADTQSGGKVKGAHCAADAEAVMDGRVLWDEMLNCVRCKAVLELSEDRVSTVNLWRERLNANDLQLKP
jgi:hypothetical protein